MAKKGMTEKNAEKNENTEAGIHPIKKKVILLQAVASTSLVVFSLLNIYLNPPHLNLGSYMFDSSTWRWAFTLTLFFLPLFLGIAAMLAKNTNLFIMSVGASILLSLYPAENHIASPVLLILSGLLLLLYVEFGHAVIRFFYFDIYTARHGFSRKGVDKASSAEKPTSHSGVLDVGVMVKRYFFISPMFFGATLVIVSITYLALIFWRWVSPPQLSSSVELSTVYGLAIAAGVVLLIVLLVRLFLPEPGTPSLIRK